MPRRRDPRRGRGDRPRHADEIRSRSDSRELEVTWAEGTVADGAWVPPDSVHTVAPSGRAVFRVPATSDATAWMESASAVGPVSSFRFEPPSLDDVFAELVATRRANRTPAGADR